MTDSMAAFNTGNPVAIFDTPVGPDTLSLIRDAVDWLEVHGMTTEGLWRTEGSSSVVKQLITQIQSGSWEGFSSDQQQKPSNVTGVLVSSLTRAVHHTQSVDGGEHQHSEREKGE